MGIHILSQTQQIPISLAEAWEYFSNPANLAAITPSTMGFEIISVHHGEKMYPGQIIEYYVRPLLGIKFYWMTEITHVDPMKHFVDEQRFGPYKMWHHQHFFREISGGVEMTDLVHYKNPGWMFGKVANWLFVEKKLKDIFEFRRRRIAELFGGMNATT